MKTKLKIVIILLATVSMVVAATLTIDIPAQDVQRVAAAYGNKLALGRSATMNEVAAYHKQVIIEETKRNERNQYTPPPMVMEPTPTPTPTEVPSATPTATAGLRKK